MPKREVCFTITYPVDMPDADAIAAVSKLVRAIPSDIKVTEIVIGPDVMSGPITGRR